VRYGPLRTEAVTPGLCPGCDLPKPATEAWPLDRAAAFRGCPYRAPRIHLAGAKVCVDCLAELTARLAELQPA
jgi:hypothetical protein